jgi:hypothetical protein
MANRLSINIEIDFSNSNAWLVRTFTDLVRTQLRQFRKVDGIDTRRSEIVEEYEDQGVEDATDWEMFRNSVKRSYNSPSASQSGESISQDRETGTSED